MKMVDELYDLEWMRDAAEIKDIHAETIVELDDDEVADGVWIGYLPPYKYKLLRGLREWMWEHEFANEFIGELLRPDSFNLMLFTSGICHRFELRLDWTLKRKE